MSAHKPMSILKANEKWTQRWLISIKILFLIKCLQILHFGIQLPHSYVSHCQMVTIFTSGVVLRVNMLQLLWGSYLKDVKSWCEFLILNRVGNFTLCNTANEAETGSFISLTVISHSNNGPAIICIYKRSNTLGFANH